MLRTNSTKAFHITLQKYMGKSFICRWVIVAEFCTGLSDNIFVAIGKNKDMTTTNWITTMCDFHRVIDICDNAFSLIGQVFGRLHIFPSRFDRNRGHRSPGKGGPVWSDSLKIFLSLFKFDGPLLKTIYLAFYGFIWILLRKKAKTFFYFWGKKIMYFSHNDRVTICQSRLHHIEAWTKCILVYSW